VLVMSDASNRSQARSHVQFTSRLGELSVAGVLGRGECTEREPAGKDTQAKCLQN
jgi:hypothetical protein